MLYVLGKAAIDTKLIVEIVVGVTGQDIRYRNSFLLDRDISEYTFRLPASQTYDTFIDIYPEDRNSEHDIEIYNLGIYSGESSVNLDSKHDDYRKTKLVIWDLDNTVWHGVLSEGDDVELNSDIAEIICGLDQKGIVNSISSKNDYEEAVAKLQEFCLGDFFVFSKVNWTAKSINIKKTIGEMNISADTVIFVDDSVNERAEVVENVHGITVLSPQKMIDIYRSGGFNVWQTEATRTRRSTYKMKEQMLIDSENYNGSNEAFLKSCRMLLKISHASYDELDRCYELFQRTNQLNCSGRRLGRNEIEVLWKKDDHGKHGVFSLSCSDRYGDYGLVGFVIVENGIIPVITDMAISCRVAGRRVEHRFLEWFFDENVSDQKGSIGIIYRETKRNKPIEQMIIDLGMETEDNKKYIMKRNPHYSDGFVAVEGNVN